MKTTQPTIWKLTAGVVFAALLTFVSSASATLVTATDNQNNASAFTPTWPVATGAANLLNGLLPTSSFGTFTQESAGGLSKLTDGAIGPVTGTAIFATCGNNGGRMVIYDLPASANGYDVTNITTFSGWGNGGRHAQAYTLYYATKAAPRKFYQLGSVVYSGGFTGNNPGQPSANRVMWTDSAGAPIAGNVAAIMFDFNSPTSANGENGYSGYSEITVQGSASAIVMPQVVSITTSNQSGSASTYPFTPSWTLETLSLIAGMAPSSQAGNFNLESQAGTRSVNSLTANGDQSISLFVGPPSTTSPNYVTCGGGSGAGATLIYTLTNNPVNGIDVTNIVVYNGWADNGRFGQYYTVSYSTIAAPLTYVPISTVFYLPSTPGSTPVANRVAITAMNGVPLGTGVATVKFDFSSPPAAGAFNNGYQGYSQIIVQGKNTAAPPPPPSPLLTQDILPSYAATVVGDQVVFTAAYSNAPPASLQWLFISGGVTNVLSGQTSATLTLNNVQLTNSGTYVLKAVNATNGAAAPSYSSAAPLVVNNTPAPRHNIVMLYAEQLGQGAISPVNASTNFYPTWTVNTNNDLILNSVIGSGPGTFVPGSGNFNIATAGGAPNNPDPTILSDGSGGYATYWPNVGGNLAECSCGTGGAGDTMTYTLPGSATYGFDVTNITVYGGWGDAGRNEQKYEVLYSTMWDPTKFISLGTFDYNPTDPSGLPTATRTMLIPVSGALAQNVYAVEINWNVASAPKNNWEGYSEIVVQGTPSQAVLVQDTLPAYAETVAGDQVIFTAAFSNSPSVNLQWQFLTTNNIASNISGATTATLTLNNVQVTNTGSYRLAALNTTSGTAVAYSTPAPLVVGSVPAPVNNIILKYAGQSGLGAAGSDTNFYPTWVVNTNHDLVLGFVNGSPQTPGQFVPGTGNFGQWQVNTDPTILSDGTIGYISYWPNVGASQTEVSCGVSPGGLSMTYTLITNSAPYGFDLTNVTVYGGWGDSGRNEQKYEVLYSTVANPTVFNSLGTFDYNPNNPYNTQSATRTTLVPALGAMARNVFCVQFNWNLEGSQPKNGQEGYSEIIINGAASPPVPTLNQQVTPLTAEDVVGSSLTIQAGFSGATSYQWQKNGTNISGATTTTLTLSNLQLADTATNGGYSLVASNSTGAATTFACAVTVDPAPAAVNNVITAFAYQTDTGNFIPTWDTNTLSSSLIYGQYPPSGGYDTVGNFNDPDVQHPNTAGGLLVLTDGSYGTFANDGSHPAFATAGNTTSSAGKYVIYTLGAEPNGYNVTNIEVAGGWNDNGRNSQFYTVSYSTVANPTLFIPITVVSNRPSFNNESVIRATIKPATGVLASNVYAIFVDFTTPIGVPNGYSGYSEISVFGSPSVTNNLPTGGITVENQSLPAGTPPSWTIETDSLIAGKAPSAVGPGNFQNEAGVTGTSALTDGTFGNADATSSYATCGDLAGQSVTYTSASGWNLTNIVVYSGWGNYDRDGQFYHITYSTLSGPTTFIPLASVSYNPPDLGGASANRVNIAPLNGAPYLATNVYAVTFDFTPQTLSLDYGYSGYAEIVLEGIDLNLPPPTPPIVHQPKVSGGNLILTGSGGTPNYGYAWLTTTNLLTPLTNWTVSVTGVLDATGSFSNAIPINISQPGDYFRLWMP